MDLKQAYRALDPARPLEPGSPFYTPRPDNPVSLIETELQLADRPKRYLLTGHRGSGKTTELGRIESALEGTHLVLTVIFGPAEKSLETTVLLALAETVQRGAFRSFVERLGQLKIDPMSDTKDPVNRHQLQAALRSLNMPLVVLIDGVDKLDSRGIQYAFEGIAALSAWPISVVCTVPLTATLEPDFGQVASSVDAWHFLPGIALWNRKRETIEAGWELCREVIERRANGLFSPEALDVVVRNSAGIHREILRIAQRACALAAVAGQPSIGAEEATRAVHELRNEYSIMLRSEDHARLREVERTGRISGDPGLLRLVRDQFVVAYGVGGSWFDVHPIVRPLVASVLEEG